MLAEHIQTKHIHVLLIEDSHKEALLTRWQLSTLDDEFEFHRSSTLRDALVKMEAQQMDVIVLDLGLPDSDGPNSLRVLTERFPNVPIVVLSGRSDEVSMMRALQNGAQEFLIKGECSPIMIRQAMRAAIFRKSLGSLAL